MLLGERFGAILVHLFPYKLGKPFFDPQNLPPIHRIYRCFFPEAKRHVHLEFNMLLMNQMFGKVHLDF